MSRNYHRGGGGSCLVKTSLKPKVAANQEALDRLSEMLEKFSSNVASTSSSNNRGGGSSGRAAGGNGGPSTSNFAFTIKRAMKSLREATKEIKTIEDALSLKYIGDRLARVVVPNAPKTKRLPKTKQQQASCNNGNFDMSNQTTTLLENANASSKRVRDTINSSSTVVSKASAKEAKYLIAKEEAENIVLPNGPWKVILLVDIREHKSRNVVAKCQQSGIPCEERALPIGDMAWVARCRDIEVLLGTILERKEVNDLASSVFGTRFLEQRLRLFHSGLPQILYLVEGDVHSVANCSAETLRMAMMETRAQLGFEVIQTRHLDDSVRLLKGLHRRLVQRAFPSELRNELPTFVGRGSAGNGRRQRRPSSLLEMVFDTKPIPPFAMKRFTTYAELKTKIERDREAGTKTVGAVYGAMLKQVASFSQKKCQGVANVYPTMNRLLQAYDEVTEVPSQASPNESNEDVGKRGKASSTPQLVKEVTCGQQRIGPKSATELDIVCCMQGDGTMLTLTQKHANRAHIPKTVAQTIQRPIASAVSTTLSNRQRAISLASSSASVESARVISEGSNTATGRTISTAASKDETLQISRRPTWCDTSSSEEDTAKEQSKSASLVAHTVVEQHRAPALAMIANSSRPRNAVAQPEFRDSGTEKRIISGLKETTPQYGQDRWWFESSDDDEIERESPRSMNSTSPSFERKRARILSNQEACPMHIDCSSIDKKRPMGESTVASANPTVFEILSSDEDEDGIEQRPIKESHRNEKKSKERAGKREDLSTSSENLQGISSSSQNNHSIEQREGRKFLKRKALPSFLLSSPSTIGSLTDDYGCSGSVKTGSDACVSSRENRKTGDDVNNLDVIDINIGSHESGNGRYEEHLPSKSDMQPRMMKRIQVETIVID